MCTMEVSDPVKIKCRYNSFENVILNSLISFQNKICNKDYLKVLNKIIPTLKDLFGLADYHYFENEDEPYRIELSLNDILTMLVDVMCETIAMYKNNEVKKMRKLKKLYRHIDRTLQKGNLLDMEVKSEIFGKFRKATRKLRKWYRDLIPELNNSVESVSTPKMKRPLANSTEESPSKRIKLCDDHDLSSTSNGNDSSTKKCNINNILNRNEKSNEETAKNNNMNKDDIQTEVDDVESIVSFIDTDYAEENAVTEEMKQILSCLKIDIDWDIPEAHLIETRFNVGPTKEQQILLKHCKIKHTHFSKNEDEILMQNWSDFCLKHDLPDDPIPFLQLQHGKEKLLPFTERKKFVQFLGRGLNNRSLFTIYRRFKILYTSYKTGRYTKEEDDIILRHTSMVVDRTPKFAPLVSILNRSRRSIEARYNLLISNKSKKVVWTPKMEEKLIRHLLNVIECDTVYQLENAEIAPDEWRRIGKLMSIPHMKIIHHWHLKLCPHLFLKKKITDCELKLRIIKRLRRDKIRDWKLVDWKKISKDFDGLNGHYLWYTLKGVVRWRVPSVYHKDLGKCLQYLKQTYVPLVLREQVPTKLIPRLIYTDGKLKRRKDDNE